MDTLNLRKGKSSVLLICGKPEHGKSHLLKYITSLYCYNKCWNHCLLFSSTYGLDGDYDFMPEQYCHLEYSDSVVNQYISLQREAKEKGIDSRGAIIIDDITSSNWSSKSFKNLARTYRHSNIDIIIICHTITDIPPSIHDMVTHAFIFRQTSANSFKHSFEKYGAAHFENVNDWRNFLVKQTREPHHFVFVNAKCLSDDINDVYKKMCAPANIPKFKLKF